MAKKFIEKSYLVYLKNGGYVSVYANRYDVYIDGHENGLTQYCFVNNNDIVFIIYSDLLERIEED